MRFVAIVFTALLALAANALPPGTDDEIDARLAPYGKLNRAAVEEVAVAAAPDGQQLRNLAVGRCRGLRHLLCNLSRWWRGWRPDFC